MLKQSKKRIADIYPDNAILKFGLQQNIIEPSDTLTIPGLFSWRVGQSANKIAYTQYEEELDQWIDYSWQQTANKVQHWRNALFAEKIEAGQRVAICLHNCHQWVLYDQAAMAGGLVLVPLFAEDRADNIAYIIESTESRILFLESVEQWLQICDEIDRLKSLQRVIVLLDFESEESIDPRVITLKKWLSSTQLVDERPLPQDIDALATIVFTSGTTGQPKGVMLSHRNLLENVYGSLQSVIVYPADKVLSFLPLSHMFERTVCYYISIMAGVHVTYNRSITHLLEDLAIVQPTMMVTVPRIFERVYKQIQEKLNAGSKFKQKLFRYTVEIGWHRFEYQQKRITWRPIFLLWPLLRLLVARKVTSYFGGNLRLIITGGAPLAPYISKTFIGLGLEILQGYGLTEASPVLSINVLEHNKPSSIGFPLRNVRIKLGKNDELLAHGSCVMLGYWKNKEATEQVISADGWLYSGDIARIDQQGFISITGRIKEIIVMDNGEKVPPADMEAAICDDPLFSQAMVIGEGKPYLSALIVINPKLWQQYAKQLDVVDDDQSLQAEIVEQFAIERMDRLLHDFPGYANIRRVTLLREMWTTENGMLTPTLKIKRPVLREKFAQDCERMYEGY